MMKTVPSTTRRMVRPIVIWRWDGELKSDMAVILCSSDETVLRFWV
jgi:RES domain-containing protein